MNRRRDTGSVDWAAVRARYPVATNSTFLNITSGTPLSNAARPRCMN